MTKTLTHKWVQICRRHLPHTCVYSPASRLGPAYFATTYELTEQLVTSNGEVLELRVRQVPGERLYAHDASPATQALLHALAGIAQALTQEICARDGHEFGDENVV